MPRIEVRVAALVIHDGSVLLVNHQKKGQSYWVLPGGHVECGETLRDALVREMNEELALYVTIGPLVIVHDFITDDRHVVNHVFMADAPSAGLAVDVGKVLKDAKWVPLDTLDSVNMRPAISAVIRQIARKPHTDTIYLGSV